HPKRGKPVARRLYCEHAFTGFALELLGDGQVGGRLHIQTSSIGRRLVIFFRSVAFRLRIEGSSGRSTPCGPTTQLNGRRSLPTEFCSSSRPSRKASGRGGQPGTYTSTGRNLSTPCTTL